MEQAGSAKPTDRSGPDCRHVGSAIWKAVRRGAVQHADALEALDAAMLPFGSLVPTDGLRRRAVAIAIELDHPIYDCFYLALAERDHARLGSDGGWLIEKAKALRAVTVIPL